MALPEALGGLGLDPQTTGMVWEELARWGAGFAATLMPGAVVPQLISFLAPDNKALVATASSRRYTEDTTGPQDHRLVQQRAEVGSDGSNYDDCKVHHHTMAVKNGRTATSSPARSPTSSRTAASPRRYIVFACIDPARGCKRLRDLRGRRPMPGAQEGASARQDGLAGAQPGRPSPSSMSRCPRRT